MPRREAFKAQRFILAEGNEDAAFIRALVKERKNLPDFDVSPTNDMAGVGGNSGFETALLACEPIVGFDDVTEVVVVADNDEDPDAAFRGVCAQLDSARREDGLKRQWGVPTSPGSKAQGNPSVSIWMWPSPGQPGCFETLLWDVIKARHPDKAKCIDTACRCSNIQAWPISKLDKARVRSFLAMEHKKNPALALSLLWRDAPKLIPLSAAAFTPVYRFLGRV